MKKVIVLAALALGAGYLYSKYGKPTSNDPGEFPETDGSNDVVRRELTDDEARYYAATNSDIKAAFGNDLVKIKDHWYNWGYMEDRISPYGQAVSATKVSDPVLSFDANADSKKKLFS